jgi:DNA-binding transcriptional LysR family regulator
VSIRQLSVLQWFGALAAAGVTGATFLAGAGLTQAECNPGLKRFDIPHTATQIALTAAGVGVTLLAEWAAFLVYRATRTVEEQDPPPEGRQHFFAAAALAANVIFLMIILLTGIAALSVHLCRQG